MRFLADIPIGRPTILYLSACGHEVIHVSERLPTTADDKDIVELAVREDRTILCFDLDFADLVALSGKTLPSVITFRTAGQRAAIINRHLERVLPDILPELARGVLVTVDDHRVRIRQLPIQ